jgi:hypothetical protein
MGLQTRRNASQRGQCGNPVLPSCKNLHFEGITVLSASASVGSENREASSSPACAKVSLGIEKHTIQAGIFSFCFHGWIRVSTPTSLGRQSAFIHGMNAIAASLWVFLALPGPAKGNAAAVTSPSMSMPVASATVLDNIAQIQPVHPVLAAPAVFAPGKLKPLPAEVTARQKHTWLALTIAQHSASTFDAWSTRYSITSGHAHELDPLMKPFAGSAAIYGAIQVAPAATDFLGRRLLHSSSPKLRKLWWLPQTAGTIGFIVSALNNVGVAHGR